ncbi:MAG TPA: serine--tRNA ligase [Gemmatimonadaceae bacterium]|jgi:seryl-tRNA synthetase|nr:serine--tRNA ligase [Gemmatimonadaceae bacterium]
MHDIRMLRDHPDVLREAAVRRNALDVVGPLLDRGDALDRERRALIVAVEERKAERNTISQEVARRKRAAEDAQPLIAQGRTLGDAIAADGEKLAAVEAELHQLLLEIPNVPLPDVPAGGEEHNVIVKSWGTPRDSAGVRPHWDVMAALGMLDVERAARISGSGFVVYRGRGTRLVRALLQFFMDTHASEHGYEEIWPPQLVTRTTMTGTGQLPKFEDDAYATRGDDLFLIPTAEVPVTNLYRDEILDAAQLPMGFVAYSRCFRREAGSAGKDTRGLLRTHEFDKVELVRYVTPESNDEQLELLTRHAEMLLERLELPYRRKLLAAGDTGFSSARTYDLEVWAPGVGAWLEVSSCSTFTDFQARRANIRFRPAPGEKPRFVYTLNGSGLAFPRTIACLLEHHQQPDGSVLVPAALRPYLGMDRIA